MKRVFDDNGHWNQEAVTAINTIDKDIEEIFEKLQQRGFNFREAQLIIESATLDYTLIKGITTKK